MHQTNIHHDKCEHDNVNMIRWNHYDIIGCASYFLLHFLFLLQYNKRIWVWLRKPGKRSGKAFQV
jgi:hypothetical protein